MYAQVPTSRSLKKFTCPSSQLAILEPQVVLQHCSPCVNLFIILACLLIVSMCEFFIFYFSSSFFNFYFLHFCVRVLYCVMYARTLFIFYFSSLLIFSCEFYIFIYFIYFLFFFYTIIFSFFHLILYFVPVPGSAPKMADALVHMQ